MAYRTADFSGRPELDAWLKSAGDTIRVVSMIDHRSEATKVTLTRPPPAFTVTYEQVGPGAPEPPAAPPKAGRVALRIALALLVVGVVFGLAWFGFLQKRM